MDLKRPEKYLLITDEQKDILIKFYRDGMTSTTAVDKIDKAAKETNIPPEKVKKWIGNYRRKELKRTASRHVDDKVHEIASKKMKGSRKLSAQNIFYSKLSKEGKLHGLNNVERNKYVMNEWKALPENDKKANENEAKRINALSPKEMDENEKRMAIKLHKKRLYSELAALEDLGIETSVIMLDEKELVCNLGSEKGIQFLQNSSTVNIEFKEYFDVQDQEREMTYKDLQVLFNEAYCKALGYKGARVPYLKGNFEIHGLPTSIAWRRQDGKIKKPSDYGTSQIKEIMKVKDEIKFIIKEQEEAASNDAPTVAEEANADNEPIFIPAFFHRLVGEDVAKRALNGREKIREDELEVLCTLRPEEEEMLLDQYAQFFEVDALQAIKLNLICEQRKGVVFPTYTRSKKFWLFYYSGKIEDIEGLEMEGTIPGKWLNKVKGANYTVLPEIATIKKLNIIQDPKTGDLLHVDVNLDEKVDSSYDCPKDFLKVVREALSLL